MHCSRLIPLLAALALPACASVQTIEQELGTVKGQSIQAVVAKIGPPTSEQKIAGGTNYTWTSQPRLENVPVTTTTTDYSTGRPNTVESVSFVGQMQSCTLLMFADTAGIIGSVQRDGPNSACADYIARLKQPK